MNGDGGGGQGAFDAYLHFSLVLSASDNEECAALPSGDIGRGGGLAVFHVGRGEGHKLSLPFGNGLAGDSGIGAQAALFVNGLYGDVCQVLASGADDVAVGGEPQADGFSGGGQRDVLSAGLGTQHPGLVGHFKHCLELRFAAHRLCFHQLVVQVKFHLRLLGIDFHLNGLAFPAFPVPALPCGPCAPLCFVDFPAETVGLSHGHIEIVGVVPEHIAIMADGLSPSRYINVAAIGAMPVGLSALGIAFARPFTLVVGSSDARFAQVVEARPHHVAHHIRVVVHRGPVAEGVARIALRLPHHAPGVAPVVAGVLENHIVVAADVEHLEMGVVDFPVAVPGAEGLGDGARGVDFQHGPFQLAGGGDHADVLALNDLVAQAPGNDARVVAVAQHHGVDVLAVAGVDHGGIVVFQLCRAPPVEGLANDEHAQRVAGIEKCPRGGVVAGADEVEARLLHLLHLAYFGGIEGHGSQHAVVVVHAGAVEEHGLTVEHEAPLGVEREGADAVLRRLPADDVAAFLQLHGRFVAGGMVGRPQLRIAHDVCRRDGFCLPGRHAGRELLFTHRHHGFAVAV